MPFKDKTTEIFEVLVGKIGRGFSYPSTEVTGL